MSFSPLAALRDGARPRNPHLWLLPLAGGLAILLGAWVGPMASLRQETGVLAKYDLSKGAGFQEKLPRVLEEISGLATTPDGRLFAHQDEWGAIYQVDPVSGEIVKAFTVGIGGTPGDFEGLAVARGKFFLLTSSGELVEVEEGRAGSSMSFQVHRTGLGRLCELEGLAFDAREDALLLACKKPLTRELKGHIVVFSVPLETMEPYLVPRVFLPLGELEAVGLDDEFHPSAIEVHPETGNLILVAAQEEALLELSPTGGAVAGRDLKHSVHAQPEGIAFLNDGTLILADEGQGRRGRLTRYPLGTGEAGGER